MNTTRNFKSDFYDESFEARVLRRRIYYSIVVFICTLLMGAIVAAMTNYDGVRRYGKISKLIYGFSQMSQTGFIITFLIAVAMVPITIFCVNLVIGDRKIIVGLVFDETNRVVKIRAREILDTDCNDVTIPYYEVSTYEERLADGFTIREYDCITFVHRGERIGSLFKDHDMWSDTVPIENEISKMKRPLPSLPNTPTPSRK